jgi:ectoine hydroxylase-related dioxygenase (phytanoyl-CoA dioxygenase family)
MSLIHLPPTADAADVTRALERDGACIVDDVMAPAVIDRTLDELAPYTAATPLGPDDFTGRNTQRTGALIERSVTFRDFVMNPLVLASAKRWLTHATAFQLHLTQLIAIGPDSPAQIVHRDQWAFDFFPFPSGFEVQFNTIWAFSDFTAENGATRVVPGSHRGADGQQFEQSDTIPAEMTKGSLFCYTGSVYHGGGANTTQQTRLGANVTYSLGWLRQEENQYLAVPPATAATLPVELLQVMGYARGAYALGYIDDMRDPIAAVRPDLVNVGLGDLELALSSAETKLR